MPKLFQIIVQCGDVANMRIRVFGAHPFATFLVIYDINGKSYDERISEIFCDELVWKIPGIEQCEFINYKIEKNCKRRDESTEFIPDKNLIN